MMPSQSQGRRWRLVILSTKNDWYSLQITAIECIALPGNVFRFWTQLQCCKISLSQWAAWSVKVEAISKHLDLEIQDELSAFIAIASSSITQQISILKMHWILNIWYSLPLSWMVLIELLVCYLSSFVIVMIMMIILYYYCIYNLHYYTCFRYWYWYEVMLTQMCHHPIWVTGM